MRRIVCSLGAVLLISAGASAQTLEPSSSAAAAAQNGQSAGAQADPNAATLQFFRSTEIGGLMDVYYDFYSTKTDAKYRNFDTMHNQFALSMAEVWFAKPVSADSRAGFKVKLNFGPATSNFTHATEPGTSDVYQHVQEAYASYLAPIGKGLRLDAGIFVTQHGAEVIEAKDNWNYSRSLLFTLAIPYYHSGIRATYVVNDKVTLMGDIVNGWNNVVDNNTGKTLGAQVVLKPTAKLSIVQNYMAGPEQSIGNEDWRHLSDTTVSYTVTPALSVQANYDYGKESFGSATVHWQGVAAYLKYQVNKWFAVSPRFEYYDDPFAFTTGVTQKLKETTVTFELRPVDSFIWRIEYRGDFSDIPAFATDKGVVKKNQQAIVFGVMYSFSTKTP